MASIKDIVACRFTFYIEKEVLYMAAINNTEIMLKDIGMVYRTNDGRDVTALTGVTLDIEKGR